MTPHQLVELGRLAGRELLECETDERLVYLARAGNDPAFEAIMHRYRPRLLRYGRQFLPSTRSEDAVQQAFINAYRALHADDRPLHLEPWLFRIAHNTTMNILRERDGQCQPLHESAGPRLEDSHAVMERGERVQSLFSAIRSLPGRQRRALVLRELEGRDLTEIGAELGVSAGAARQLIHRARNKVRAGVGALTPSFLFDTLVPAPVTKVCAALAITGAVAGGTTQIELPGELGEPADLIAEAEAAERGVPSAATAGEPDWPLHSRAVRVVSRMPGSRGRAAEPESLGEDRADGGGPRFAPHGGTDPDGLELEQTAPSPPGDSGSGGSGRGGSELGSAELGGSDSSGSQSSGSGTSGSDSGGSAGSGSSGSGSSESGDTGSGSSGSGSDGDAEAEAASVSSGSESSGSDSLSGSSDTDPDTSGPSDAL